MWALHNLCRRLASGDQESRCRVAINSRGRGNNHGRLRMTLYLSPTLLHRLFGFELEIRVNTVTMTSRTHFLDLAQELRDTIYTYALDAECDIEVPSTVIALFTTHQTQVSRPFKPWNISYPSTPPPATYLSLMKTCRQLHAEIAAFLSQSNRHVSRMADIQIEARYPHALVFPANIPRPPRQLTDLHIKVNLHEYFDSIFNLPAASQPDVLLRPIAQILQRFSRYGPYMSRQTTLSEPLKLRTIRITIDSAIPFDELTYVFGNPKIQLAMIVSYFKTLAARLARSGILTPIAEAIEVEMESGGDLMRNDITYDEWDEGDYVYFKSLGFEW